MREIRLSGLCWRFVWRYRCCQDDRTSHQNEHLGARPASRRYNGSEVSHNSPRGAVARKNKNMLILSRKLGEQIVIADNIVITVVEIRGDKVRLGIEAPREVPVHRKEIYELIQREKSQQPDGASTDTATGQSK